MVICKDFGDDTLRSLGARLPSDRRIVLAMPSRRAIRCGMVPSLLFIVESPWQAKHRNASTDLPVWIIWLPESANLHAT